MIYKLSPEQIARFPEFVDKWTKIGLSTEPASRVDAERGVVLAYEAAGLVPPDKIVWCDSPISQGITRAIVMGLIPQDVKVWDSVRASVGDSVGASVWDSVRASVGASVRASVGDSVWDSVGASVRASVGDSVWDSVGASVRDSVGASVWDSVGASVWDSVRASVGASVGASVRASVRASVGASVYGQHDANWLAFYEYFAIACGLDELTQKLAGMWLVSQSAGWWLPHQRICWISERPNLLNRNAIGRLHSEVGPALSYPDGWVIWAIDGVLVDEQIVLHPETQTVAQIDAELNNDKRSLRIDRFGWPRYIAESGFLPRDERENVIEGTIEALYRTKSDDQRLVVTCPTGRVFALGVPSDIATCEQAQHWLAGGKNFRVLART